MAHPLLIDLLFIRYFFHEKQYITMCNKNWTAIAHRSDFVFILLICI